MSIDHSLTNTLRSVLTFGAVRMDNDPPQLQELVTGLKEEYSFSQADRRTIVELSQNILHNLPKGDAGVNGDDTALNSLLLRAGTEYVGDNGLEIPWGSAVAAWFTTTPPPPTEKETVTALQNLKTALEFPPFERTADAWGHLVEMAIGAVQVNDYQAKVEKDAEQLLERASEKYRGAKRQDRIAQNDPSCSKRSIQTRKDTVAFLQKCKDEIEKILVKNRERQAKAKKKQDPKAYVRASIRLEVYARCARALEDCIVDLALT